jgi:Phytanoyl-CoA dioxygenase (PhyH)
MTYNLTNLNVYALKTISNYPQLKAAAQKFRYFLMRGPCQKYFISYYRKHSKTKSAALPGESLFEPIDTARAAAEIESQSYSASLQLPPEIIKEVLAFQESENSNNIFHPHRKSDLIKRIALDPQILAVIREYFRAEPIFYGSRLYNTPPRVDAQGETSEKYKSAKMVHFDVTDFMDINVFFYLSDVDLDTSPHIVVPGTHKRKSLRDLYSTRYSEQEARKRFKTDFVTLTGKAGLGFFEDSGCFHIQSLGKKGRMMLSFCYTLHRKAELALN